MIRRRSNYDFFSSANNFERASARHRVHSGGAQRRAPERNVIMMRKLFAASCLAGIVITGAAAPTAYAGGGNPSGTGQPSVECGEDGLGNGPHGFSTGGFANAETQYAGSEGTPSAENGNPDKAISQYDVACAHAAAQVDATAPTMPDSTTLTAPGPDTPKKVHPVRGHN
jgi:hypothetical protein